MASAPRPQVEALFRAVQGLGDDLLIELGPMELSRLAMLAASFMVRVAAAMSVRSEPVTERMAARWLKPREAALRLSVSRQWLWDHQRQGVLPFCHPMPGGGKGFRVDKDELDDYMKHRR